MRERITSSRIQWDDWGDGAMWQVVASSETFTDAHVSHCSSEDYANQVAKRIIGKVASFEGHKNMRAYID